MDVDFRYVGHVVVDDMGNTIDIQSASGNVCRHEDGQTIRLELGEDSLPCCLALVSVNGGRLDSATAQSAYDAVGAVLGS